MKLFTTEAVTKFHPDKYADQISDAIVTACMREDRNSRCGVEALVKGTTVVLAGEVKTNAKIDYEAIVRRVADKLRYKVDDIINLITEQSAEISKAVDGTEDVIGAGDQGIVFGYASNETKSYLPLSVDIANRIVATIEKDVGGMTSTIQNEASAPTGDFQLIDHGLGGCAGLATGGYLYNLFNLGMDLEGPWWDSGTAEFVLAGGVYFMSGSLNFGDDGVTYVLIFNKEMQRTYQNTVPNPYQTARDGEWTLDYFNKVIQGISTDNGDGKWDELDTYGFINTWEYGNTFFIGSDLRYINNTGTDGEITLFLTDKAQMEKALDVLELSQAIYHNNNASFMSPPGEEGKGQTAFKENRGLFYGEVAQYLSALNREMTEGNYGVLPVPKYDKAQEFYRTWTHDSGSAFSVTSAIPEKDTEVIGQIMSAYAILSHQKLKPAYYDTMLKSRGVQDAESAEILDLIFQNRIYDLAFYFDLGFYDVFKSNVNDKNSERFSSAYSSAAKSFDRKLKGILRKLEND